MAECLGRKQKIQEVWIAASNEADDVHSFNKDRAYQLFLRRTGETTQQGINKRKAFQLRPWMYAAAMTIIVFICGTIAFQTGKSVIRKQLTQISIEAPYGSKTKLYLPDGTLVWLNAGSKMSYAQDFGINERALNLTGEAYFEVTKNKHIPFKVHTDELDVKVLGTKFNFRNYQDDLEAKVCLLEAYSAEWTNDRLYFDEALLPDIVKELERSYNIKITIADAALNSVRFYGNFRRREQSIREIMDVLSSTDKMTYIIEGKNIVITLPE